MKYMSKFTFSILLILTSFLVIAQKTKTDSIPPKIEKYGIRFGADISKLVQSFYDKNYKGIEFVGDYRVTKNYYLAGELGNENIDMDITDMVNDWLSGGSVNNGIGVAYRRDYESLSTDTRYVSSFYTEDTNSAFKPFIEVVYNQSFQDDRLQVSNNRTSRLFLYTFSGNSAVNYFSASTVEIQTLAGVPVFTGMTPTQMENGVYYIDVLMNSATRGQQYKDVWQGITFVPGVDQQDITQVFTIRDNLSELSM